MDDTVLRFESINRGAQILLSDGSAWRAGLSYISIVQGWRKDEFVRIEDSESFTHPKLLVNEDRDETVPVVQSASL